MRVGRRTAGLAVAGVLVLGGVTGCGGNEAQDVQQRIEEGGEQVGEGAEDVGNEAEQEAEEEADD